METHDNLICCLQKQIELYKKKQSSAKKEIIKLKRMMDTLEQERQLQRGQQDHMEGELSCLRAMCSKFTQGKEKLEKATACKEDEIRELCGERQDLACKLEKASTQLLFMRIKSKGKEEKWDDLVDPEALLSVIRELSNAKVQLEKVQTRIDGICEELEAINSGDSDEEIELNTSDIQPENEDETMSVRSTGSSTSTLKEQELSDSFVAPKSPKTNVKESGEAANATKQSVGSKIVASTPKSSSKAHKSGYHASQSRSIAVPKSKTRSHSPGSSQPYQMSQQLSKAKPMDSRIDGGKLKERKYATAHLLHHCRTLSMQEMFGSPCVSPSLNSVCAGLGHSRIKIKKHKGIQTDAISQATVQGSKKSMLISETRDLISQVQSKSGSHNESKKGSAVQSKIVSSASSKRESVIEAQENTEALPENVDALEPSSE